MRLYAEVKAGSPFLTKANEMHRLVEDDLFLVESVSVEFGLVTCAGGSMVFLLADVRLLTADAEAMGWVKS